MSIIRTPDERFAILPGFPFVPHYTVVHSLRIHYVDEGRGQLLLCLHGEPTWSYLYRKIISSLAGTFRVMAMDFIGFGRSDKFTRRDAYSFQMHCDTLVGFIETLGLTGITLVVQNWGGLIGLTVATQLPERIARLVIMNTGLPTGQERMNNAFMRWREFVMKTADLPVDRIVRGGMVAADTIPDDVIAAYAAPFPDASYKAGAAAWPLLVPVHPDDPGAAEMRRARQQLSQWQKPALVMFSDGDPITHGGDRFFRRLIPGAKEQPKITISGAGHFLQEEKGEEIAHHIAEFMERTPYG